MYISLYVESRDAAVCLVLPGNAEMARRVFYLHWVGSLMQVIDRPPPRHTLFLTMIAHSDYL